MKQAHPVDIMQECTALFNQEDTLAFFDFQYAPGGGNSVDGLCRIARPKRSLSGQEYVSIVFIMDTPGAAAREHAAAAMKELSSGILEKKLPEISSVVSMPQANCGQETCIKQIDIMLKQPFAVSEIFISERLYPAVRDALSMSAGELCWWEDMKAAAPVAPAADAAGKQPAVSFTGRLREKLFSN